MAATLDCIRAMGGSARLEGDAAHITGTGGCAAKSAVYPCRESGSTLRFCIPPALVPGGRAVFTGAPRLLERGIGIYEDVLPRAGIRIEKSERCIALEGTLTAGEYTLRGDVSSQFISGSAPRAAAARGGQHALRPPPCREPPLYRHHARCDALVRRTGRRVGRKLLLHPRAAALRRPRRRRGGRLVKRRVSPRPRRGRHRHRPWRAESLQGRPRRRDMLRRRSPRRAARSHRMSRPRAGAPSPPRRGRTARSLPAHAACASRRATGVAAMGAGAGEARRARGRGGKPRHGSPGWHRRPARSARRATTTTGSSWR